MLWIIKLLYLFLKFSVKSVAPVYGNFSNKSLVDDTQYVKFMEENYPVIREKYSNLEDDRLRWELIKITISFSKGKTKHRRSREIQLQNRLED